MIKIIALYLPQFHETAENNKWWGKGFTEWDNCKRAVSRKKNNYQPRVPLNENYYNLLNENDQINQANIAKKYGVSGFCYYHYWFCGKLLLQKPMENMLSNKKIDIPFCISWANHSWMNKNNKFNQVTLLKQEYGDKEDWIKHFYFLLSYFKDERYIKVEDKPMLVIHDSPSIVCWVEMKQVWDELAKQNGLNGIFYVNTLKNDKDIDFSTEGNFDAQFECQPTFALNAKRKFNKTYFWNLERIIYRDILNKVYQYDYDKVWKFVFKKTSTNNVTTYLGAYNDWDIIPRWGDRGNFHSGASPEKFEKYLKQQVNRAKKLDKSEFLFINAWNEWSEGAYLEPDEKYGYKYLEAVKQAQKVDK